MKEGIRKLRLDEVLVPPHRLRELDTEKASSIAASLALDGQLQPIAVYHSSRAARPYTLIFGLHRYEAHRIVGLETIDVVIRTAEEALRLEIAENLFRFDLNVLDRATFAAKWSELAGVKMGRPKKAKKDDTNVALFGGRHVSDGEAERMGLTGRAGQRLRQIEHNLLPELKAAFRGTDIANNQAQLLKCARLATDDQVKLAAGMREGSSLDFCLKMLKPRNGQMDETQQLERRLHESIQRLPRANVEAILAEYGLVAKQSISGFDNVQSEPSKQNRAA